MTVLTTRATRGIAGAVLAAAMGLGAMVVSASPAGAVNLPQVPVLAGNPNPGTDLFASTIAVGTGGTERLCATSPRGIPVHCVEHVAIQPAGSADAVGTTYAHWIFCREVCAGGLLVHEMVHVAQFEQYGDLFGPMYLLEAAQHGSGCDNQWERPAYQTGGQCL
jgi:hypothetical protein